MQTCKTCKKLLPFTEYHSDSNAEHGFKKHCKTCVKANRKRKRLDLAEEAPAEIIEPSITTTTTPSLQPKTNIEKMLDEEKTIGKPVVETNYPHADLAQLWKSKENYSIAVIGSRRSGKTTMLGHHWNFFKKQFDLVVIFCMSLQAPIYKEFLTEKDRELAFEKYSPDIITDIERIQKGTENALKVLFFFDDCSSKKGLKFDDLLQQLYIRGRNMNASVLFSTQSPMFIQRDNRANVDFLVLFRVRSAEMNETLINTFISRIVPLPPGIERQRDRFDYYQEWLTENTKDHSAIIINFDDDNKIYKYKANSALL